MSAHDFDGPNSDLFDDDAPTMLTVTASRFPTVACKDIDVVSMPWAGWFAALQHPNIEPNKTAGRLIKFATFGDIRKEPQDIEKHPDKSTWSLKHDENVLTITGVEGDYDKEVVTIAQAKLLLEKAGIRAIFYTSWGNGVISPPKHNGGPRWRVLCPLSEPHKPGARTALLARVNGVLGGILSPESFVLSQGYFFGKNPDATFHCEATFNDPNAGSCINELDELDDGAIGKRITPDKPKGDKLAPSHAVIDESIFADAVATKGWLLATGDDRRELLKRYVGSRSGRGVRPDDIRLLVAGIAAKYFDPNDPFDEKNIDTLITDICGNDERRRLQQERSRAIGEGDTFCPLPEVLTVADMVNRFVFLENGSQVFDTLHPKHVLKFNDFKNATAASVSEILTGDHGRDGKPKGKLVVHAAAWLQSLDRLSAFGATFYPGEGAFVNDPNGRHCVNTWAGFDRTVQGDEGNAQIFIDHIRWLFKDRADDFLDWLAHIEQRPGELPHTCWLHIATSTGMGRNAMAALLARVFAGYTAPCVDLERMLSATHNDEMASKVLAVVDEIHVGGGKQWAHTQKFKQTITAAVLHVNTKYGLKSVEHNATRWLIFSNYRSAIPLEDSDRRVEVVTLDDDPQSPDYYTRLYQAIVNPAAVAGFAQYLARRDLTGYNHGAHAKRSDDKLEVIDISRSPMSSDLIDFSESYPCDIATIDRLKATAGILGKGAGDAHFQHALRDACWEPLGCRVRIRGGRTWLYVRRQHKAAWLLRVKVNPSFALTALPKQDGGLVEWPQGDDSLF